MPSAYRVERAVSGHKHFVGQIQRFCGTAPARALQYQLFRQFTMIASRVMRWRGR
ncbi:hypothetical protein KCP74_05230 [Salmonella enterica subsp. enterica]|nr:hypothetical protein KCP74_05230 [Salmonella enterica subsp. enterica]